MNDPLPPPQGPARLPPSLGRLWEVAHNVWWSWHPEPRALFEALDRTLWKLTSHNPVKLLRELSPERALSASADPAILRRYEAVLFAFDEYMSSHDTWFARQHSNKAENLIAYFSAEFALHQSIPIYSGGLGILAGDHCKEASDLGVPLVGIGFLYPQGYFHQRISADGWQQAWYEPFSRVDAPIRPALLPNGERLLIQVNLAGRTIQAAVWQLCVGRVSLFLLDTDVEANAPWDRDLSARLYGGDQEMRILQEIILGIGGVRALRALGLQPTVWHANEGHTAFLTLERLREYRDAGLSVKEAIEAVQSSTVFTTHTPVPAGHDAFPFHLIEKYFTPLYEHLGLSREDFMRLGCAPGATDSTFNMTVLGLQLSGFRNGVSRRHGEISRRMWASVWPETPEDRVPITSVTNGIHVPTWIASEIRALYSKYLGPDWVAHHDDPTLWERLADIPDHELWNIRMALKRKLFGYMNERARRLWIQGRIDPSQVLASGTLLDPDALTIGFARRFATYKRATLLFKDLERLKRLLQDPWRPVQIIFAGKAHPDDDQGKYFIHEVYSLAKDHGLGGHIAFVEEYDMHTAKFLIQGVDVWLNTPRSPQEACGTSGQKAALNGVPNLSVLDGWWAEGYNGANGWAIGGREFNPDPIVQDAADAEALFKLLEQEVVPLFYARDGDGVPRGWLGVVRETIRSVVPRFCARRMVREYAEQLYVPAGQQSLTRR
ncbi:MAG TPA: alpha-glucan family phosphorylase [Nitrospirales bacterium]|nr:alpha-glucan family phosphorylase [Nitrospirales bacterium]